MKSQRDAALGAGRQCGPEDCTVVSGEKAPSIEENVAFSGVGDLTCDMYVPLTV